MSEYSGRVGSEIKEPKSGVEITPKKKIGVIDWKRTVAKGVWIDAEQCINSSFVGLGNCLPFSLGEWLGNTFFH